MNKIGSFIQAIFCLLLLFTGCKDDDMGLNRPGNEADSPMDAIFALKLDIEGGSGMSRTEEAIGNAMERRISTVQVFAVPLDENEKEQWGNMRWGQTSVPEDFNTKDPITVQVPGFTFNKIHVYVGANMNGEQKSAFIKSKTGYHEMTKASFPTYYSAINQLAPFPAPWQPSYNRDPENIVMFATNVLTADIAAIETVKDEETGEIKKIIKLGTSTLKRVVAKVLLTCETVDGKEADNTTVATGAEGNVQYVKTQKELNSDKNNLGPRGWIRQEDVYYFINNMPRRVKFLQEYEEQKGIMKPKPNYNLKGVIVDILGVKFSPIKFNREKIREVYIHYDINELYKRNQSFQPSKMWSDKEYNNLIADEKSVYNEKNVGMYTAENMFSVEDNDFTEEELKQMKEYDDLPFLTKVAIAAKFTPRYLFVTYDEWHDGNKEFAPMKDHTLNDGGPKLSDPSLTEEIEKGKYNGYLRLKCANEKVAHEILTYSLKMHGHFTTDSYDAENNPYQYPANTFFVYFKGDDIFFCSYGVASVNNSAKQNWPEMIPYTGGWNYYYTHINNEGTGPVQRIQDICIERNNYYILKLTSIGSLGTSVGDNKYIEVHTLKSDWKDGGKGEITLH